MFPPLTLAHDSLPMIHYCHTALYKKFSPYSCYLSPIALPADYREYPEQIGNLECGLTSR